MTRARWIAVAGALLIALTAAPVPASAGEVGAAAVRCWHRDSDTADSGVSRVTASLYYCEEYSSSWFEVRGTLYDTSCDDRTAYVGLTRTPGGDGATYSVSGCGKSGGFTKFFGVPVSNVHLMTRACNLTCSSKATMFLYS